MKFDVRIEKPCSEDWAKMKIGLHGRFCDSCTQRVVDFTAMSREEILRYLLNNRTKDVCAKVNSAQLDFLHHDVMVTIRSIGRKTKDRNLAFYLLTLATISMISCVDGPSTAHTDKYPRTGLDTSVFDKFQGGTYAEDGVIEVPLGLTDSKTERQDEQLILGQLFMGADTMGLTGEGNYRSEDGTYFITPMMPEFVGGMDSLSRFLEANLAYPKWEEDNGIEGKVYVRFIVDSVGNVRQPEIVRSVVGSKNIDAEVLRVMALMPPWKPGESDGRKVDVHFHLPIRFTLGQK